MSTDVALSPQSGSSKDYLATSQGKESSSFSNVLKGESPPATRNEPNQSAGNTDESAKAAEEPVKEAKTTETGKTLPEEGKAVPEEEAKAVVTAEEKDLLEKLAGEGDEVAQALLDNLASDNTIPLASLEAIKQQFAGTLKEESAASILTPLQARASTSLAIMAQTGAEAQLNNGQQQASNAAAQASSTVMSAAQPDTAETGETADATKDDALQKILEQRFTDTTGKSSTGQASNAMLTTELPRSQQAQSAPAPTVPQTPVSIRQPGWDQALTNSVQWMSRENLQQANIRVSPAELGPITVKVSMQDDQLKLTFSASHAATREALESALPRLREVLSASGMNLGNVDVNDQGMAKQFQQNEYSENGGDGGRSWRSGSSAANSDDIDPNLLTTPLPASYSSSAIDIFA